LLKKGGEKVWDTKHLLRTKGRPPPPQKKQLAASSCSLTRQLAKPPPPDSCFHSCWKRRNANTAAQRKIFGNLDRELISLFNAGVSVLRSILEKFHTSKLHSDEIEYTGYSFL
jgi:hypothetical protein